MFSTAPAHRVVAWRAARVGFGATLIAGAIMQARGAFGDDRIAGMHAAHWFAVVWVAAFAIGALAWGASRLRRRLDPDALAVAGMVVPSIGLALMMPLTLHLPVVLQVGTLHDFDEWVQLSLFIAGTAHVALAVLSAVRARQLARGTPALSVLAIYGAVVAVSMIPFAVLYLIPPIVVAVTGLAYVPVLRAQELIATRERAIVEGAPPVARAIAA